MEIEYLGIKLSNKEIKSKSKEEQIPNKRNKYTEWKLDR